MATYREEIDKIYKKIDGIVSKGNDYYLDYNEYIDTLVNGSQYGILTDVFYYKYGIDSSVYENIADLKKKTFEKIKTVSISSHQKNLAKLLDEKNVYTMGYHYFSKLDNKYLGDIIEIEINLPDSNTTFDTKLYKLLNENKNVQVLSKISDDDGLREALPKFELDVDSRVFYNEGIRVRYDDSYYQCTLSYTWSKSNQITPTFSTFWDEISPVSPTQSLFSDPKDKILDKYSKAIDFINQDNFN
jgi:hypothetical protein